tara:strand:+ start:1338 stop:2246 length:909 start_codon:yes stop_codon:yes gene_type:complete
MKIFFKLILLIVLLIIIYNILINNDYWYRICLSAFNEDYVKWYLCDKYVAKQFAKYIGFNVPKTYQLVKYPYNIKFNKKKYVVKPVDLCDGEGVYLINNNINMITNNVVNKDNIIKELCKLRASTMYKYYMHCHMYNNTVPFTGYIVEELLLDNEGNIPIDYKCYVFGGKLFFIAVTYDRQKINNKTHYKTVWMTKDWVPMYFSMSKKNYYYNNIKKPDNLDELIYIVEKAGKILNRHCRIDVYNVNNKIYFSEFTFFCGAFLHTFLCNTILGVLWHIYPDKNTEIKKIKELVPNYYNKHTD